MGDFLNFLGTNTYNKTNTENTLVTNYNTQQSYSFGALTDSNLVLNPSTILSNQQKTPALTNNSTSSGVNPYVLLAGVAVAIWLFMR